MNMDIDDIDIDRLRRDLIDYYMAAMFNVSPIAIVDLTEVEYASDEMIVRIALRNGFDLSEYTIKHFRY